MGHRARRWYSEDSNGGTSAPPPAPPPSPPRGGPASEQLPGWAAQELSDLRARAKQLEQVEQARVAAEQRAQQLEQQARQSQQRLADREMDLAMIGAGGDFGHEDVRRFFRDAYRGATTDIEADKRPAFDAWFGSEAVRQSPLYSRFFQQAAPPTTTTSTQPPPPPTPPAPPPNVDEGAGGSAPPGSAGITPEQIAAWGPAGGGDLGTWRQRRAEAQKALAAKYRGVGAKGG